MNYEQTIYFNGDAKDVIVRAKNILLPLDFEIVNSNDNSIELMMSYFKTGFQNNPLVYISRIFISIENNKVLIKADFRNNKINNFLLSLIPIGVIIFLIISWRNKSIVVPTLIITSFWLVMMFFAPFCDKPKINIAIDNFSNTLINPENIITMT